MRIDDVLINGAVTFRAGDFLTSRMGRSHVICGGVRGIGVLVAEDVEADD